MTDWDARQYLRFADERGRPCRDLAERVMLPRVRSIVDVGCGPGNSTAVLRERWPEAEITGFDRSPEMIAAAGEACPEGNWVCRAIEDWVGETEPRFDLVFSNAALQWVKRHGELLPALMARVNPGGALAVQLPANSEVRAQRLIREMAASGRWRFTGPVEDWHTHEIGFYYDALAPHAARLEMWETEYLHVMDCSGQIVEFYRGSALRPFLAELGSEEERAAFLEEYTEGVRQAHLPRAGGKVLFPFRRMFMVGYRGE
jgi:trans-aconitate 2-methyltransferase